MIDFRENYSVQKTKLRTIFLITTALIIPLLATIPSWVPYLLPDTKELSYKIESQESILSESNLDNIESLGITFDGKKIEQAQITVLSISNTGTLPIEKSDFSTPLTISSNQKSKFLSAILTKTIPEGINTKVTIVKNIVEIEPLLLNPNDSLSIRLITSGEKVSPKPIARIKGVASIQQLNINNSKISPKVVIFLLINILVVSLGYTIINDIFTKTILKRRFTITTQGNIILFLLFTFAYGNMISYFGDEFFPTAGNIEIATSFILILLSGYLTKKILKLNFIQEDIPKNPN